MDQHAKEANRGAFYSVALLLFSLGVSVPCTLYLTNSGEFSITLADLLMVCVPALLACLGVSYLLIRALPFAKRPRAVSLLFALAIMVWAQGNILVWQYGALDGRTIDWASFRLNGVIDTALWVAVFVAAWRWSALFARAAILVVPVLIVMQVAWIFVLSGGGRSELVAGTVKAYSIDQTEKYTLSRDRNIILMILDETQSDVFAEVIDEYPDYRSVFGGFTYFPNAVAGANYTELAVPALLTGRLYDNAVPKQEYMKVAFLEESVFAALRKSGVGVDIYPWLGWANESVYFDESIADNLASTGDSSTADGSRWSEKQIKEIVYLADLSLFRSVPHFAKALVYDNNRWFLIQVISRFVSDSVKERVASADPYETLTFGEEAARLMQATRPKPQFKYYHLKGTHGPLKVTPDLKVSRDPVDYTRPNYVLQMRASIEGVKQFLAALKERALFDSSLIIIVGDHGSGHESSLYIGTPADAKAQRATTKKVPLRRFARDKARGVPLVLVKGVNSSGEMVVSRAPVSLLDVPATILVESGVGEHRSGRSMLRVQETDERERAYGALDMTATRSDYVGSVVLYSVRGDSWRDESWTIVDVLSPPADSRPKP